MQHRRWGDGLRAMLDAVGERSRRAQGLGKAVTDGHSALLGTNRVYVLASGKNVLGLLKVGPKRLFVAKGPNDGLVEINPMCVLDFYVVEGHQRSGLGSTLFRTMLAREGVSAERLAYDRPSPKLLGFLRKHFGLAKYMPQSNNFVVFDAYWSPPRHRSSASTSHGNASGSRQGSTPTPPGSRHRPPLATGQPSPSAGSMLLAEGLQEPPPGTRRSIGSSSSSAHAQRHGSGRGTDAATGVAAIGEMPRRVAGATPPPLGRVAGSSSSRTNLRDRREDQSSLPDEVPAAGMPSGGIPVGSASSDGVTGALHGYGHAPASHRRSNSSGTGRSASPLQQVARSMLPSSRHQAMPAAGMRR